MKLPAAPADLARAGRGRRFWREVLTDCELSAGEMLLLAEACRTLDELDALRRSIAKQGATVKGSVGQTRVHPALGEVRQLRAELRRLLDALNLPEPVGEIDGEHVVSLTSRRAQKAARSRWAGRGSTHGSS